MAPEPEPRDAPTLASHHAALSILFSALGLVVFVVGLLEAVGVLDLTWP